MNKNIKQALKDVINHSYSKYSGFRVGAAVEMSDGTLFTGTNIENASYSLTICAERVAIFKAVSEGRTDIKRIYVYTDSDAMPYPCGACLQVISEFCSGDTEISISNDNEERISTLDELMPERFSL